jgi:broad specificity phosphatase PhoE
MLAFLVRHGETEHNAQGIFQGYDPIPLSTRGRQQAALVAERLLSIQPRVFYSSDILRAQETAAVISQRLQLPIQLCPGLREWHVGTWAGQPVSAFEAHLQALGAHPVTYTPEGGESQLQTQTRMVAQMCAFANQHAGETVLCVSHGRAIDLFVRHVLGLDVMRQPAYHIANTSVSVLQCQNGVWEVITLNEIRHLEHVRP